MKIPTNGIWTIIGRDSLVEKSVKKWHSQKSNEPVAYRSTTAFSDDNELTTTIYQTTDGKSRHHNDWPWISFLSRPYQDDEQELP